MSNRLGSRNSFLLVLAWIAVLWLVFLVQCILVAAFGIDLAYWAGLQPRTSHGLWGILGAHLLHANLPHIISNSIGLLILGLLSCWYSQRLTAWAVGYSAICAGGLTWLIAPSGATHIGASGVVFGLVGFLVANGIFRKSWAALLIALPVGFLFWQVIPGMLPTSANQTNMISWQMHLGGFIGGAIASWELRTQKAGNA